MALPISTTKQKQFSMAVIWAKPTAPMPSRKNASLLSYFSNHSMPTINNPKKQMPSKDNQNKTVQESQNKTQHQKEKIQPFNLPTINNSGKEMIADNSAPFEPPKKKKKRKKLRL